MRHAAAEIVQQAEIQRPLSNRPASNARLASRSSARNVDATATRTATSKLAVVLRTPVRPAASAR
ncbi:MAG: hypothetical protein DLM68_07400 [Hyphomicrobiales bacterium]|nr:MAG: hypothetical protein DLM68_07400 [Hyphomicrobiales bacterium]